MGGYVLMDLLMDCWKGLYLDSELGRAVHLEYWKMMGDWKAASLEWWMEHLMAFQFGSEFL